MCGHRQAAPALESWQEKLDFRIGFSGNVSTGSGNGKDYFPSRFFSIMSQIFAAASGVQFSSGGHDWIRLRLLKRLQRGVQAVVVAAVVLPSDDSVEAPLTRVDLRAVALVCAGEHDPASGLKTSEVTRAFRGRPAASRKHAPIRASLPSVGDLRRHIRALPSDESSVVLTFDCVPALIHVREL
jgi:hypothetical protein